MMHGTADYAAVSGRGTEPAARALLSFDCTFLALLAASVSGEDSPEDLLRCPFKPFGKKRAMARVRLPPPSILQPMSALFFPNSSFRTVLRTESRCELPQNSPCSAAFKKARLRRPEVYAAVKKRMRELASVEAPYRGSRAFPRRKAAKNDSAAELRSQTLRSPDLPANIFGEMLRDVLALAPFPEKETRAKETGFLSEGSSTFAMHGTIAKADKKHSLFNPVQYLRLYPR